MKDREYILIMGEKKTVFVSGSNRGIGRATVELFAKRGWNVIAHARQFSEEFEQFANEVASANDTSVTTIYFDMCDEESMKAQIKEVISKPKVTIDALVNNAGVMDIKLFMMTSFANVRNVFEINLFSHMRLTQLLLKRMTVGGSIVNVASMDGIKPQRGETAYASSKAAMLAWTEVLQKELIDKIRVNAIAPCAVNTDMSRAIADKADWSDKQLLEPYDIAKAIYFLSSEEAAGIAGDVLKIAGKQI